MLVKNYSHFAHITSKNPEVQEDINFDSDDSDKPWRKVVGLRASQWQEGLNANKKKKKAEDENESSLIADPNQLDLINNLNSTKLIDISEAFEKFP